MATDNFDDYDDVPPPTDPPVLQPLHPDEMSREELRAKYLKPGFGFWMAVVWVKLYMFVMQILAAFGCGIPVIFVAMAMEAAQGGQPPANPQDWMKTQNGVTAILAILLCSHLVGLFFGWLILRWQVGRQWKRVIALTRGPSSTHVVLLLIGFPAMIALSAAVEQPINKYVPSIQDILNWLKIPIQWPGLGEMMDMFKKAPLALMIFTVAILSAFNEELWCRGFLANGLSRRYSAWVVVIIVSIMFGYMHLEPKQGLGAAILGVVIHAAYLATRSLWVAIAIHFANNGLAVVHISDEANFPLLQPLEEVLQNSPALYIAGAASLFSAVVYALYQTRCKLAPIEPGMPTWEPKGVSAVELPPPNSGTIVAHDPISTVSVGLVLAGAVIFGMVLAFA